MPARERLFHCEEFALWRVYARDPFTVGAAGLPRVLVCIDGAGHVEHGGAASAASRGDVLLLPAVLGTCVFRPTGAVTLLEIELPESATSAGAPNGQRR
jgi:mannose-6-phosphate isomerase